MSSATVIIRNGRLSFDKFLFEPNEKKKHSVNVIAGEDTTFSRLKKEEGRVPIKREDLIKVLEEVLKAKFTKLPAKYENWAVRKNSEANHQQSGERFKGYEGDDGIYFSPSRYAKEGKVDLPTFVRKDGSVINTKEPDGLEEAKRLFYAGCYVSAKLNFAAYEVNEGGVTKRGVTTYLEALQFLNHGEPFRGSDSNADGFDNEGDDEGEDGLDPDNA